MDYEEDINLIPIFFFEETAKKFNMRFDTKNSDPLQFKIGEGMEFEPLSDKEFMSFELALFTSFSFSSQALWSSNYNE